MLKIKYLNFISALVIVYNVNQYAEAAPHQRTLRLCSKSLSDALYLVCSGRGYNEPFTYNDGIDTKRMSDRGLVDECCYHSCSLEQLEQYCKPVISENDNSNNGEIEESLRIVNLPYSKVSTLMKESMQEEEEEDGPLKSKKTHEKYESSYRDRHERVNNSIDTQQRGRINKSVRQQMNMGINGNKKIEELQYNNCKRRRNPRRRCSKAQFRAQVNQVPNFMIGTILPESSDSVLLFPSSKFHQDYWRVTRNFHLKKSHKS